MKRIIIAVLAALAMLGGCSEDEEYGIVRPPPTNNPISSVWAGRYYGTARLQTADGQNRLEDVELRVTDLGEDWVKVRIYFEPSFVQSERGFHEGQVLSVTRFYLVDLPIDGMLYSASLDKSGPRITGSMLAETQGQVVEWRITAIDVEMGD